MNKQIEEMAKDLRKSEHWYFDDTDCDFELDRKKTAKNLYDAGYRKQSEGHWYKHDKRKHGDTCYYCSACEHMALADCMCWALTDYCPNCGAKMKGGE